MTNDINAGQAGTKNRTGGVLLFGSFGFIVMSWAIHQEIGRSYGALLFQALRMGT